MTFLCLANYFKGTEFFQECSRLGCRTVLLINEKLRGEPWPDCIDEIFNVHDLARPDELIRSVSYLARERVFDVIVPLDDYAVETAASLREHLRCPGMGESTARYFRDKLAMRGGARDSGLLVPEFVHVLNHRRIHEFTQRVSPPWLIKPRSEAGSVQIKKFESAEELWPWIDQLGDRQSFHVLESYISGDVFHVDSIVFGSEIQFAAPHRYWRPPFNVWNEGGIFMSQSVHPADPLWEPLLEANRKAVLGMGLPYGVTHAEFIRGHQDGRLYFLEVAARCGGAHIDKLVMAQSGIQLWQEWARVEAARVTGRDYDLPPQHDRRSAGILLCLSRFENPDLGSFDAPEVFWKLSTGKHAGMVVASQDPARVQALMEDYCGRLTSGLLAVAPPSDKPA
ncbi:MAG: ATPase [Armatimonadetes bacterium]|nr:ATPase [Armatimonadota bacterium]